MNDKEYFSTSLEVTELSTPPEVTELSTSLEGTKLSTALEATGFSTSPEVTKKMKVNKVICQFERSREQTRIINFSTALEVTNKAKSGTTMKII